jgi:Dolichyl-phosphate-mannose-protein mannosyltransferase
LLATFALRAWCTDQPIVENFVGRQIPTAMVARNLERGGSFLWPEVDTGPFPNYFLVEPPIYAVSVVAFHRATGLALEPAGRLVSALGMTLAAWGLFGLVRRREPPAVALLAVLAFAVFPITIRYGRAFQPDSLMLGTLVVALWYCDERAHGGSKLWGIVGWVVLATGLALKITSAYVLIPLALVIQRPPRRAQVPLLALALAPALLWYAHATNLMRHATGPSASAETAATWFRALVPTAWLHQDTYSSAGWFLIVRAFTPLGFILAAWSLARSGEAGRLWRVWALAAAAALVVLAGKLHHEYYWLALAPVAAWGTGWAIADLAQRGAMGRWAAATAATGLVVLSLVQSTPTWRTPAMWTAVVDAAALVRAEVPEHELLVAPEALLYYADRRGYRLEYDSSAVARAARELGNQSIAQRNREPGAFELLSLYDREGVNYVADLIGSFEGPKRRAFHEALRTDPERRYQIQIDQPGVVLVARRTHPVHVHRGPYRSAVSNSLTGVGSNRP